MVGYPNPHPPGCPWAAAADLFGAPNVKWCEQTLCSIVSEPANTWSNVAFFIVGARLIAAPVRPVKQLGWAVVAMGGLSFAYHLSNNFLSQALDFLGMFVALSVIVHTNLARQGVLTPAKRLVVSNMIWAGATTLIWPLYRTGFPYQLLVAALACVAIGLEGLSIVRLSFNSRRYFVAAIAAFAIAGASTGLDRRICYPGQHFVNGHALWHVIAAVGFWLLALHWRDAAAQESSASQAVAR